MKYILTFILIIFFTGCSKNSKPKNPVLTLEKNQTLNTPPHIQKDNIIVIKFNNFKLSFKNNKLIYPKQKTIILFDNNNTYSKAQEAVLKRLNVKYYKTDSDYLQNYFKIQEHPTIVVLDQNKTVKYENFTPYEILKEEGF